MTISAPGGRDVLRFAEFELDVIAYQLRRAGRPVPLERRPMDLLLLLVSRRGQLVTRAEIVDHLWGKDVFVDVETGVHTAMRKIRRALGDSIDTPLFIETVPGKGYRFVAAVGPADDPPATPASAKAFPVRAKVALLLVVATVAIAIAVLVGRNRLLRSPERVSLAVLPFENLTRETEHDYLADGLAEETIVSLGQIDPDRLRVLGRTSTIGYRDTRKSLRQIGEELGVDYLVESTIRADADRVRVTSRLTRVRDQVQIWSSTYDRTKTSILGLQSELSIAIAEQIHLHLSPTRLEAISRRHTRNAEAYHAYLRGLDHARRRTPAANQQAIASYRQATTLDPDYALAWAATAYVHASSTLNADAPPRQVWPGAREAAQRALAADPNLSEAQHAVGYVHWTLDWKWTAAEAHLRRAVVLDPESALARVSLGHCLSQMGRHSEALAELRRARELAPSSPMTHALSAQGAFQARDFRGAVEHARQATVIESNFWVAHVVSAQAHYQLGERDLALDELLHAARYSEGNSKAISQRGYMLARSGRVAEARHVLETLQGIARERWVPPYALALVHAGLGDADAAFEWLERAYAERDVHLMFLPVEPFWDEYRSDPRFQNLIARCGFTDLTTRSTQ